MGGVDQYFHELAEHSNAVLWMFTADFSELLSVNSAYETIYGQPAEELDESPTAFLEAIHPDDRGLVETAIDRLAGGEAVDLEYRVNPGEDYSRRVWVEGEPIRDDAGEVVRIAGTSRDVTERRNRELELERSATIIEASGDPVYSLDRSGRFTFVNDAFCALAGHPAEDFVGAPASLVFSAADIGHSEELIAGLVRGDATRDTYEIDLQTADGETVPCENHIALLPSDDSFRGTVGVLRDISVRREREAELQRQVDRFEAIFETIPEPIVHVVFEDGVPYVRRVNPAFAEVFGLTTEEIQGQSINEAIVPPDRMVEARKIDEQSQVGDTIEREVQRVSADGLRDFRFRVNWFEVVGERREAIGVYVDITDRKRRERELQRQNERLDEFASVVSHDLRNPLNVIEGHVELARSTGKTKHFDAMERATDRMATLIEDLLSLARAGATVDSLEPIELSATADRCWKTVETADATIETVETGRVLADPGRLRQLFENLFRNAVEHGGEAVTIRIDSLDGGFSVEDDGPGIPPEDRDQVFESGYTTAEDGTGFGLRIVRTIAEAHGWDVRITEGDSGGARFEVTGVRFA